jgi:asparagine synthase (glutamine-hydrolysing)
MCGITGWAYLDPRAINASPIGSHELLSAMCNRMIHRGPDSEGTIVNNGVALGMRRLAIIDLSSNGEQPVFNEDKSIFAVLNGEIYNYPYLRSHLEKLGHRFIGESDTEVIPHLYEEYDIEMLDHLNGMFAFALWDGRKKRLVIARDRLGEKPLYWGVFDNKLIFASEPKVLLGHPSVQPRLNLDALRLYLSFDYVPAPHSIYQDVFKLPAAHALILENGEINIRRYWNLSFKKPLAIPSEEEATEHLRELLGDAVKMRLVSDVPLGILLSGGIDSSTIAALAVRSSTNPIDTFSMSFNEPSFDESSHARRVSAFLGTHHHEELLSVDLAAELISDIGSWLDEPLSDPSILPTYLLSRFARRYVTVALGGDGGDELFAGYPMYIGHKLARFYQHVPNFIQQSIIGPLVKALPVKTRNLSFDFKARRFIAGLNYKDVVARHHVWFGSFAPHEQELLLATNIKHVTNGDIYRDARQLYDECDAKDIIDRALYMDTKLYLGEDLLTKVDRSSMAVSLEVRAPFLDHRVVEFAAQLPVEYKLRGLTTKYILKRAAAPLLPPTVRRRSKKGFGVPIADWLKNRLRPLARDLLSPARIKRHGLFNESYVSQLQHEHELGLADHRKLLWTLLIFELWHESFIDTPRRIESSVQVF